MVNKKNQKIKILVLFTCILYLCFGVKSVLANTVNNEDEEFTVASVTDTVEIKGATDASNESNNIEDTEPMASNELSDDKQDQDSPDEKNKLTLLLNEEADLFEVEEALYRIDSAATLTIVEEIKLVQIELDGQIGEEEIMSDAIVSAATSDYGTLVDIELEGVALTDIDSSTKSITLENVQEESDSNVEDLELLSSLVWYVDEVTEQVNVQLISDISTSKVGIYPVTVSLKDQSGNETLIASEVDVVAFIEQTEPKTELESESELGTELSVAKHLVSSTEVAKISQNEINNVKEGTPKTGDENEIFLLVGIMVINILMVDTICVRKNHKSNPI